MRVIHLQNLPRCTYVKFGKKRGNDFVEDRDFLFSLCNAFKNVVQDVKNTTKKIGVPFGLVYKILSGNKRKIRLEYLAKIANFLRSRGIKKYALTKLEDRIYSLSCPHKGELKTFVKENDEIKMKFPFRLEGPEAMKALTFPFTDGYILEDYSGYVRVGYVNSDLKMHREVIRCVQNTFGDVRYSQRKIRNAHETYFAGILGKIYVYSLGFTPRNKLKTNVHLHEILRKTNNPTEIGAIISQVMDDEGSFNQRIFYVGVSGGEVPEEKIDAVLRNFHSPHIQKQYMPNILKDVKSLLEKINVRSQVKSPVRYFDHGKGVTKVMWYLTIQGPSPLLKLHSICKFKNEKLRRKFTAYAKHRMNIANVLRSVQEKKGFLTANFVKEAFGFSTGSAKNILVALKRDGQLEIVEKGKYQYLRETKKSRYLQTKFKLTNPNNRKVVF